MTTPFQPSLPSLYLRKHRMTFTEGMAGLFDDTPITRSYRCSPTSEIADGRAVAADFVITGNDLRDALDHYGRRQ